MANGISDTVLVMAKTTVETKLGLHEHINEFEVDSPDLRQILEALHDKEVTGLEISLEYPREDMPEK